MDNPPEAVKAMARSILARGYNSPDLRREILTGAHDKSAALKDILTAIIETSELCAKWLDSVENETSAHFIREGAHLPETSHEHE